MKKRLTCVTSLILVFATVFSIAFGIIASASEYKDDYDLSKVGSPYNKTLTSADILEDYLGEDLLTAERNYLISYSEVALKYDDGITTSNVSVFFENETLTVKAYEYIHQKMPR